MIRINVKKLGSIPGIVSWCYVGRQQGEQN